MKNFRNHAYFIVLCLLVGCAGMSGSEEAYIPPATSTPRHGGELKTFHIRPDGGDTVQCTGQADQPYPGEGTGLDCAWDHPFRALPPGGPARIQGGDTLIIHSGNYAMGTGAVEGLNPDVCSPGLSLGLHHAACAEDHPDPAFRCERDDFPYGDWAVSGLYAQDASHITLQDITIHGMGVHGIMAGQLSDWHVENLALEGNGWVGWEGDIDGDDSNSGTLEFSHWTVTWNGCVESYPLGEMLGCCMAMRILTLKSTVPGLKATPATNLKQAALLSWRTVS